MSGQLGSARERELACVLRREHSGVGEQGIEGSRGCHWGKRKTKRRGDV